MDPMIPGLVVASISWLLNMLGAWVLYQLTGNLLLGAVIAIVGTLAEAVIISARGKLPLVAVVAHGICIALLASAFFHFGDSMVQEANKIQRDIVAAETQHAADVAALTTAVADVAAVKAKQAQALANTPTAVVAAQKAVLAAQNKLAYKRSTVTVWDDSKQCTNEKHTAACADIRTKQMLLAVETQKIDGTLTAKLTEELNKAELTEQEKRAAEQLSSDNLKKLRDKEAKVCYVGCAEAGESPLTPLNLLILSISLAVIVEWFKKYFLTPPSAALEQGEIPDGVSVRCTALDDSNRPAALIKYGWLVQAYQDHVTHRAAKLALKQEEIKSRTVEMQLKASAERTATLAQVKLRQLDAQAQDTAGALRIKDHLNNLNEFQLRALLRKHGVQAVGEQGKKMLRCVQAALAIFTPLEAVSISGLLAGVASGTGMQVGGDGWKCDYVGQVSPFLSRSYISQSIVPVLVSIGVLINVGSTQRPRYVWANITEARLVVGADVVGPDVAPPSGTKPKLRVV